MMRIVNEWPPIIADIEKVFGPLVREPGVAFCWGTDIMLPNPKPDADERLQKLLVAHETIHSTQQAAAGGPALWWARYLGDAEFRIRQESPAHRTEYLAYCAMNKRRDQRANFLRFAVDRLSGPLYGNAMTRQQATRVILGKAP
jgi:hypothetical protein